MAKEPKDAGPTGPAPTHYNITVSRPVDVAGATLLPAHKHRVKASVYEAMDKTAIASATPLVREE